MSRPCDCDRVRRGESYDPSQCRLCWLWHDQGELGTRYRASWSGMTKVDFSQPAKRSLPVLECIHRGAEVRRAVCPSCAGTVKVIVFACSVHGECHLTEKPIEGVKKCTGCNDRVIGAPAAPHPFEGKAGVVVGCYGWPKLARIQIRTIREMCGVDTPILIADDGSPAANDMALMCQDEGVMFAGSKVRVGHCGGDRDALRKGILWGVEQGLDVVAKVSQRMVVTSSGWLSAIAGQMSAESTAVAIRSMTTGRERNLRIRTEAFAVRVAEWSTPAVLAHIGESSPIGTPTELLIDAVIRTHFKGKHSQWRVLGPNRYVTSPGTIWHCTHGIGAYRDWAARYGLTLDDTFYTDGHQGKPGFRRG